MVDKSKTHIDRLDVGKSGPTPIQARMMELRENYEGTGSFPQWEVSEILGSPNTAVRVGMKSQDVKHQFGQRTEEE